MAHLIRALAYGAVEGSVQNHLAQRRAVEQQARWHSPLSRLGRCGIFSIRAENAVVGVLNAVADASQNRWRVASDVRYLDNRGGADELLVFGNGRMVVVRAVMGTDYSAAVARVDYGAQAVCAVGMPEADVSRIVCRADTTDEPRPLPGPSGSEVMVTGLPWLSGLLRRELDRVAGAASEVPEALQEPFSRAWWRLDQKWTLSQQSLRCLAAQSWWVAKDLYLDDGIGDPVDLVLAGPGAVFVLEFERTATAETASRVIWQAHRLRGYLPYATIAPIVVREDDHYPSGWPVDPSLYPVAALAPDQVLGYAGRAAARGLPPPAIATLNAPWPQWWRRVTFRSDGSPNVQFGWAGE